jgi:hypothetical protein
VSEHIEDENGICDKCSRTLPEDDGAPGPKGSSWEGGNLCPDCCAEETAKVEGKR